MKRGMKLFIFVLILAMSVILPASAKDVLLWKFSGPATLHDPEMLASGTDAESTRVGPEYALEKALIENRHKCTIVEELPGNLSAYDIIFVTVGFAFLEEG